MPPIFRATAGMAAISRRYDRGQRGGAPPFLLHAPNEYSQAGRPHYCTGTAGPTWRNADPRTAKRRIDSTARTMSSPTYGGYAPIGGNVEQRDHEPLSGRLARPAGAALRQDLDDGGGEAGVGRPFGPIAHRDLADRLMAGRRSGRVQCVPLPMHIVLFDRIAHCSGVPPGLPVVVEPPISWDTSILRVEHMPAEPMPSVEPDEPSPLSDRLILAIVAAYASAFVVRCSSTARRPSLRGLVEIVTTRDASSPTIISVSAAWARDASMPGFSPRGKRCLLQVLRQDVRRGGRVPVPGAGLGLFGKNLLNIWFIVRDCSVLPIQGRELRAHINTAFFRNRAVPSSRRSPSASTLS